jgi:hypothetical protein
MLYAYSIILTTKYDGNIVIKNEKNVLSYLENVVENYGDYSIKAFDRKAISYKLKKQPGYIHGFYVIYEDAETYHTISFSATSKWATSKGAWAMDTNTDIESYIDYLEGNNIWEVKEILTDNGIDMRLTIDNILSKALSKTSYYFRSKINKNNNHDTCYTALYETLAENE